MKKLIYSQEDLDLILSLETQEKDEEIERLNNIINKAIEYKNQLLFDLNKQYITFEKWEEILEPFENILKGEEKVYQ